MNIKKSKLPIYITLLVIYTIVTVFVFGCLAAKMDFPRKTSYELMELALPSLFSESLPIVIQKWGLLYLAGSALAVIFFMMELSAQKMRRTDGEQAKGTSHWITESEYAMYKRRHINNPAIAPDLPTKKEMSKDGQREYGISVFKKLPPKEVEDVCKKDSLIISQSMYLNFDNEWARKNTNALIVGTAGSGKSRFYVGPNILQANTNYVVTDPSGDLFAQYAKFLENEGYEVKKLDLSNMFNSTRYNPLHYIKTEKDVFTLVSMISENNNGSAGSKEEPIWKNSKEALLRAALLYLWKFERDESKKNLTNALKLITSAKIEDDYEDDYDNPFDLIFKKIAQIEPDGAAISQYRIFESAGTGRARDSVLLSATSMLTLFGLEDVRHLTTKDEMKLEQFADSKQAIFLCIPTKDPTYNFIASLLYSQLFLMLYDYAEETSHLAQKVCMKYNEGSVEHNDNIKVFQAADEDESENAKEKAEELLKRIKKGLVVEYSEKKDLWYIKTKADGEYKGKVIAWRGDVDKEAGKKKAEDYAKKIEKYAVVKPGEYMKLPEHCHFILDEFANTGKIPDFCQKLSTIRKYRISCSIIIQSPDQLKNMYDKEWNVIVDNCNVKLFLGTNSPETAKWVSDTLGNKSAKVGSQNIASGSVSGSTSVSLDSQPLMPANEVLAEDEKAIVMIQGGYNVYEPKYDITKHPNYEKAKPLKNKFKMLIDKRDEVKRDFSKEFYETVLPSSKEKEEQQMGLTPEEMDMLNDIEELKSTQSAKRDESNIRNMSNKARANKDYSNATESLAEQFANQFIESMGEAAFSMTQEEVEAKLSESSFVTDYEPDDFNFESA